MNLSKKIPDRLTEFGNKIYLLIYDRKGVVTMNINYYLDPADKEWIRRQLQSQDSNEKITKLLDIIIKDIIDDYSYKPDYVKDIIVNEEKNPKSYRFNFSIDNLLDDFNSKRLQSSTRVKELFTAMSNIDLSPGEIINLLESIQRKYPSISIFLKKYIILSLIGFGESEINMSLSYTQKSYIQIIKTNKEITKFIRRHKNIRTGRTIKRRIERDKKKIK